MKPEDAEKLQLEIYRKMSGERRLLLAFELYEFQRNVTREALRREHPHATEAEIEAMLRRRMSNDPTGGLRNRPQGTQPRRR